MSSPRRRIEDSGRCLRTWEMGLLVVTVGIALGVARVRACFALYLHWPVCANPGGLPVETQPAPKAQPLMVSTPKAPQ
jgi:hypothetical protein